MSWLQNIIQRVDDRMNPIVVKELRQAVQGKFLTWNLLGFLVLQMIVLSSHLISADSSMPSWMASQAGRQYFQILLSILLVTCLLLIPMYTSTRLSMERSEDSADLLYITTLSPRAIVAGKFWASLLLVVFLYSACTPFMTISFLLRGIDLPSIFVALLFSFFITAAVVQFAIFLACLPLHRWFRVLLGLTSLGFLFSVFGLVMGGTQSILSYGVSGIFGSRDIWWVVVAFVLSCFTSIGLLFVLSVSLITTPSANRVLPIRVFLTGAWLISAVYAVSLTRYWKTYRPLFVWTVVIAVFLSIVLFFTASERERLGERVRKSIPERAWQRYLVFPFYSGVGSGMLWILSCAGSTVVVIATLWFVTDGSWSHAREFTQYLYVPASIFLFAVAYALTGWWVRRVLFPRFSSITTWFFALVVLALGTILPILLSFFLGTWRDWQEGSLLLTPFVLGSRKFGEHAFWVSLGWSGLVVLLSFPWFVQYFQHFVPPPKVTSHGT